MRIGELAARTGVSVQTIRYYERRGLIPRPARTPAGYRTYGEADLDRLAFLRRAQALGFPLADAHRLLAFANEPDADARDVRAVATAQLAVLDDALQALHARRDSLAALIQACPGEAGHRDTCPILRRLSGVA
jgi:DNA-binding transcriptional MerR regulator